MSVTIEFLGFNRHIRTGEYSGEFKITGTVHRFETPLLSIVQALATPEDNDNNALIIRPSFIKAAKSILDDPEILLQLEERIKHGQELSDLLSQQTVPEFLTSTISESSSQEATPA